MSASTLERTATQLLIASLTTNQLTATSPAGTSSEKDPPARLQAAMPATQRSGAMGRALAQPGVVAGRCAPLGAVERAASRAPLDAILVIVYAPAASGGSSEGSGS
jgi:hypothetical protein